jgi:hypothetical protein
MKLISLIWIHFVGIANLHMGCQTQKILPLWHLKKSTIICFYPLVFIYASFCQFLDDIVSMFLKGVQMSSSYG